LVLFFLCGEHSRHTWITSAQSASPIITIKLGLLDNNQQTIPGLALNQIQVDWETVLPGSVLFLTIPDTARPGSGAVMVLTTRS